VIDEVLIEALDSFFGTLEVYAIEICGAYPAALLVFGSHSLAASKVFYPVLVVVVVVEKKVAVVVVERHFLELDREHECRCIEDLPGGHSPMSSHSRHLEVFLLPQ
jgi:hypothetical protein